MSLTGGTGQKKMIAYHCLTLQFWKSILKCIKFLKMVRGFFFPHEREKRNQVGCFNNMHAKLTFPRPSSSCRLTNCFWLDVWLVPLGLKCREDRRERKLKRNRERGEWDGEIRRARQRNEGRKKIGLKVEERNKAGMKDTQGAERRVKSEQDKVREAEKETIWRKRQLQKEEERQTEKKREMIRFLSPLYGSGWELPFQSNLSQAKVNNQSW